MPDNTLIVGHRGASSDAPENTLSAFRLAFDQGADWVEGDVRLTKDGQVVCIHDDTTERVTNGQHVLTIENASYDSLSKLDVGSWKSSAYADERIPSLDEVLRILPRDKGILIELKGEGELGEAAARVVINSDCSADQVVFISFDTNALLGVKKIAPDYDIWLVSGFSKNDLNTAWTPTANELIRQASSIGASGIDVQAHKEVINESFVAAVEESGLSLNVWTVDDSEYAKRLASLGISSITTNVPEELRKVID